MQRTPILGHIISRSFITALEKTSYVKYFYSQIVCAYIEISNSMIIKQIKLNQFIIMVKDKDCEHILFFN